MKKSGNKAVIAGALAITFGSASEILYAGMDERYKRYMPAYLAWFETINESFKRGCETSNMGGVEGDLADGLSKFKSNFNPDIQELIGEFNLPVNRLLYRLGNVAYQIRKKRGRK
jgi:serine/alanine adding enzyme